MRQAIAYTIDSRSIRSNVFPGLSENMVGLVPPTSPLYNKNLVDYALDPAKANHLLDAAGFLGGRWHRASSCASCSARAGPAGRVKISDIMTRNLAGVGIKVIPRPLDRGAWIQVAFTNNEFDMTTASFSLGPDPDIGIERFYNSNNVFNIVGVNNSKYINPEVDKLFDEQRVQTDPGKRKAIYDKISEIIWNDLPILPFSTYALPGVFNSAVVTGIYEGESTAREALAFAKPVKG